MGDCLAYTEPYFRNKRLYSIRKIFICSLVVFKWPEKPPLKNLIYGHLKLQETSSSLPVLTLHRLAMTSGEPLQFRLNKSSSSETFFTITLILCNSDTNGKTFTCSNLGPVLVLGSAGSDIDNPSLL